MLNSSWKRKKDLGSCILHNTYYFHLREDSSPFPQTNKWQTVKRTIEKHLKAFPFLERNNASIHNQSPLNYKKEHLIVTNPFDASSRVWSRPIALSWRSSPVVVEIWKNIKMHNFRGELDNEVLQVMNLMLLQDTYSLP